MSDVFEVVSADARTLLKKGRQPEWVSPMLATLVHQYFSDDKWIFEPKLDGERCLIFKRGRSVDLRSRNKKRINHSYPEIEAAVASHGGSLILDGEIVAFKHGAPSFARLQRRMHVQSPDEALRTRVAVFLYVFDVMFADGYDTTRVPLRERKKILSELLEFDDPIRFVRHQNTEGEAYLEEICEKPGWEGVIAKRADSAYTSSRSKNWLKFKCATQQEFVIGGYTEPRGTREEFGALLVGYYEDGGLKYAGKVGTGYDRQTLRRLGSELKKRERRSSPFALDRPRATGVHWVKPELVAQIGFTEWTDEGRLRHPRFMGLRRDKTARQVVRERAPG